MGEYFVKRPLKRPPVHPGKILREDVLPTLGLSVSEAARRLGISRQQLHRVLACTHPITTGMALRIGKFAGNGPGLWRPWLILLLPQYKKAGTYVMHEHDRCKR